MSSLSKLAREILRSLRDEGVPEASLPSFGGSLRNDSAGGAAKDLGHLTDEVFGCDVTSLLCGGSKPPPYGASR